MCVCVCMYTLFPHCFPSCCCSSCHQLVIHSWVWYWRGSWPAWSHTHGHSMPAFRALCVSGQSSGHMIGGPSACGWSQESNLWLQLGVTCSPHGTLPASPIGLYKFRVICWPCTHKIPARTTVVPEYYRVWPTLSLVGTGSHWEVPCPTHLGATRALLVI